MLQRPLFNYGLRSPWREMSRLQREMNRLFSDPFSPVGNHGRSSYPAMNVWTNQDSAVVTAELPGINPDDIDISVVGDTLTLAGSRQPDDLGDGQKFHRRERSFGKFRRTFQLPFQVASEGVEATFKNGVLHVLLPRAEEDKPKKIAIKAG